MAAAQADISIGSGSIGNSETAYPCPLQDQFEGSRAQYLFLASELNAAGMSAGFITALKFTVTSLNGFSGSIEQLTVKIGTTSTNSLSTSSTVWENTGGTYFGPTNFTPSTGVNVLTLSSPFLWDGTSNLVIEICNGLPTSPQNGVFSTYNVTVPWTTDLPFNASHSSRGSGVGSLCGTTSGTITGSPTTRPNTTFTWTAATACSGTPAPVSAVTTTPNVCPGQPFTVTLNGLPLETGLTCQWQTSTDNTTFTNIPGETKRYLSRSQTTSAYYRALITCTNTGSTQTSSSVLVSTHEIMSGNYTINSAQSTSATNFKTFADAVARLSCAGINGPVVFTVAPGSGPYLETVTIPRIFGASAVNTITFKGSLATLRYTSNDAGNPGAIILTGADHVTIDSLIVDVSAGAYGYGIVLTNQADSNRITNCRIIGNTTSPTSNYLGIMINGARTAFGSYGNNGLGNLIAGNTITGGYYGIYLYGGPAAGNKRNTIKDNIIQDFYSYGIQAMYNDSILISGNNISRPARASITTGYGVYVYNLIHAVVEKNQVHNMFGGTTSGADCYPFYIAGSGISAAQPNVLINNLVYNINSAFGPVIGIFGDWYSYWNYYHNTVVLDHAAATSGNTYGMYMSGTGVNIKNNIVYIARGGAGTKISLACSPSIASSNNNVLVMKSTGGVSNYLGYNGNNYYQTLPAWQTATNFDLQSVSIDPMFVNPATGDYTPANPFVINGVGTGAGVTTDFLGRMRKSPPDPGAFEFPAIAQDGALFWLASSFINIAGPKDITVRLFNNGSTPITSARLSYTDGVSVITEDFPGLNITEGNAGTITFATPYNLAQSANMRAFINLVNGTQDLIKVNDTTAVESLCGSLSGNYTINSAQPTGGTNFRTFNDAVARLNCISGPVVFTVAQGSGPYLETVTIPSIPGASATNTITFKGNLATLKYTSNDSENRSGIILNGADHVTIDSLVVDVSAGTYGYGIVLTGQADSNRIINCRIIGNTSSPGSDKRGIMINGSLSSSAEYGNNGLGNLIADNTITGGFYGIYLYGGNSQFNKRNIIKDNVIQDFYSYGIQAQLNDSILISGNNISRPTRTTVTTGYGVFISSLVHAVIEKNQVHNMFGGTSSGSSCHPFYITGSGISAAEPNVLVNNLVYDINSASGDIYGILGEADSYWNYYHNTIVLDHAAAASGNTYGMYLYGTGVNVKNNIVYIARGGTGTKTNIYYPSAIASSNNNVLVMRSTTGTSNHIGYYGGSYYQTLTAWQSATGLDMQSVSVDPMFLSPATGDYTPANPSVTNGAGAGLGVATDILGRGRNTPPDPGAFELPASGRDGALSWMSPVQPTPAGAKNIVVKLWNTKATPITSVQLSYTDGSSVVSEDFTGLNLTQGNSTDLTFTSPYNLVQSATLWGYINLVNGIADTIRINDTTARQSLCASFSGAYTINNAQPTGGTNFQSFSDAASRLSCGVTGPVLFNVVPGVNPYNERIVIPQIPGASAINNIVFKGNLATVSYHATTSQNRTAFVLNGTDHVTIDSLIIDVSSGSFGWGMVLTGQADSNRITNCQVITNRSSTSTNYLGIAINGSATALGFLGNNGAGNLIYNNKISGGYHGIYLHGESSTYQYNRRNEIRNNTVQDFYAYGIYTRYNDSILISKNDVSLPTRTNSTNAYGIYMGNLRNATIEKNRVHNMFGAMTGGSVFCLPFYIDGHGISASQPNAFINNLVYNINSASGSIAGIYGPGYSYWNYYHNTIVLDHAAATSGATYGIQVYGTGVNVRNNLVYIARGGTGEKINLVYSSSVASSNNNVLVMKSTTGTSNYIGIRGGNYYQTLATWRTATNYDLQSVSSDPLFTNPATGDFTPTEPAVINGVGVNLGTATDILDRMRNTPPDPGAFEFGAIDGLDGALTWVSPTAGSVIAGSKMIAVRLSNTQATPITSARVSYSDGNSVITQDFSSLNLAQGEFTTLTFSTPYNLAQNTTLYAYLNLVNNVADTVKSNDTTARQNFCVAMSGAYTINKNAPASGTNFQSFSDAARQLNCGGVSGPVVLNVVAGSGPYSGRFVLARIPGASAINTITVKGGGNTLAYSANSLELAAIILNGTDHLTIDSLVVDVSGGTYGWGILLTSQADSNRIIKCRIMANQNHWSGSDAGIAINGSVSNLGSYNNNGIGNLIADNTIIGGYYGIYVYGGSLNFNKRNIIKANTVQDFYTYGIFAYAQDSISISGNNISRPARSSVITGRGIEVSDSYHALIEKNRIHNLFGAAINSNYSCYPILVNGHGLSATEPNSVINNLIYNINTVGSIYGIYAPNDTYWNYYQNTIVLDDLTSTGYETYGMLVHGTGVNVKNNIVYINRGGLGTKVNLSYLSTVASSNNNVLVMKSTAGTNSIGRYGSTNYTTLGAWQAGTNYDLQSIIDNPQFLNVSAGDYMPTANAVDNKGADVGVTDDINGEPRSTTPDPGAYEFSTTGLDAEISWVSPSPGSATGGMKTITVNISNTRAVPITSATLSYTDGVTTQTQTFTGLNILIGGFQQLSFSAPYNFTQTARLYAYIGLINGVADDRRQNDTTAGQLLCILAQPANLIPVDNTAGLNIPISFSWSAVPDATLYDFYLWKSTDPVPAAPTRANLTQINFSHSSGLQYGTTYKWKIVAKFGNCHSESPVQTFTTRFLPDLVVQNIQPASSGFSGQSFSVNWQVKNIGNGGTLSQQWVETVYLSQDAILDLNTDIHLGSVSNLSELTPNQVYQQTASFILPQGISNNYYVFVVVNGYNQLNESNFANNTGASAGTSAIQLTPPPDLRVTGIVPPNFAFSGQTINYNFTVTNAGTGQTIAANWMDAVYLTKNADSNLSGAISLGTFAHTGALNAGGSYITNKTVTLPQGISGKYYMYVRTDVYSNVYEHALENNNLSRSDSIIITLTPPPDLVVVSSSVMAPPVASNKQNITIGWRVENQGGSAIVNSAWYDRVYISKATTFKPDSAISLNIVSRAASLDLGMGYDAQTSATIPPGITGLYYVYVQADDANYIYENIYDNNNITRSSQPISIISPDLVVAKITAPAMDSSGNMVSLSWYNKNNGPGALLNSDFTDRIFMSLSSTYNPVGNLELKQLSHAISQLASGDSVLRQTSVTLPNGVSGNYYIYVQTDHSNQVFENDKENNNLSRSSAFLRIVLSPSPDLQVTSVSVTPDTATAGDVAAVKFVVTNKGTIATKVNAWTDNLYFSRSAVFNAATATFIRSFNHNGILQKDSSYTVAANFQLPGSADSGTYYFYVFTDFLNGVYEHSQEANNAGRSNSIYIKKYPPIDLVMTSISAPDSAKSGMPVTIEWSVKNQGAAATLLSQWNDGLYLSTDTLLGTGDIFVKDVIHYGILSMGSSYTMQSSFTIPNGLSGKYYLLMVADHTDANKDINRKNNYKLAKTGLDSASIHISLTPPPDLTVTSFSVPDRGPAGQPVNITFKIKNNGPGAAPAGASWTDKVYLSTDPILDNSDQPIGSFTNLAPLNAGDEYTRTVQVFLPISASGNYIMFIKTDGNDNVYEHSAENNNTRYQPIAVETQLLSDLIVSGFEIPAEATAGDTVTIKWRIKNIGLNPATGYMKDAVYLSGDTTKSVNDVLLTSSDYYINLAPQGEITRSYSAELAGVPLNDYHVLAHTDVLNNIYEAIDTNNVSASPDKLKVTVRELPIDVLTTRSMRNRKEVYYRVEVPDSLVGESLLITLKADSLNGNNEMYLRFGEVPTRAVYDFSHSLPFQGNQEVLVPDLKKGTYYLLVYGNTGAGDAQQVNLLAKILKFEVRSVHATQGGNTGPVTLLISGSKFANVTSVRLRSDSGVIASSGLTIADPTKLYATFNLTGAKLGLYDVVAQNAVSDTAALKNGFTIVPGNAGGLEINVIAPPSTRPSAVISMTVEFTNTGNTDIINPVLKMTSIAGAPIAFNPAGLADNATELTLVLQELNGPIGRLRPGASGSVIVYAKALTSLSFMLIRED